MPSSYINSDNIGNVYLNRLDGAVLQGEPIPWVSNSTLTGDAFRELFTVKFGDTRTIWTPSATSGSLASVGIRFPVPWETLTGNITNPTTGSRCTINLGSTLTTLNSSNTNSTIAVTPSPSDGIGTASRFYCFAVLNDYAFAWCSFGTTARTASSFGYIGWLRNDSGGSGGRYTGAQFPRNLCAIGSHNSHVAYSPLTSGYGNIIARVTTENLTTFTTLYSTNDETFNPVINCVGDSTPLIFRDSVSPFPRVGMPYHLFRIPSSCTIGQVYKMATDPDNSNKPYVICCGNWGSFKVGMRVWADGYT